MTDRVRRYHWVLWAFSLSFFIMPGSVSAQIKARSCPGRTDKLSHRFIYTFGDQLPDVEGGRQKLNDLVLKNFKYPKGNYTGKTILQFVVEPNGTLTGLNIIRDPSGEKRLFGKPLFELLKKAKWLPGMCNKKKVPMEYTFAISCMLLDG